MEPDKEPSPALVVIMGLSFILVGALVTLMAALDQIPAQRDLRRAGSGCVSACSSWAAGL